MKITDLFTRRESSVFAKEPLSDEFTQPHDACNCDEVLLGGAGARGELSDKERHHAITRKWLGLMKDARSDSSAMNLLKTLVRKRPSQREEPQLHLLSHIDGAGLTHRDLGILDSELGERYIAGRELGIAGSTAAWRSANTPDLLRTDGDSCGVCDEYFKSLTSEASKRAESAVSSTQKLPKSQQPFAEASVRGLFRKAMDSWNKRAKSIRAGETVASSPDKEPTIDPQESIYNLMSKWENHAREAHGTGVTTNHFHLTPVVDATPNSAERLFRSLSNLGPGWSEQADTTIPDGDHAFPDATTFDKMTNNERAGLLDALLMSGHITKSVTPGSERPAKITTLEPRIPDGIIQNIPLAERSQTFGTRVGRSIEPIIIRTNPAALQWDPVSFNITGAPLYQRYVQRQVRDSKGEPTGETEADLTDIEPSVGVIQQAHNAYGEKIFRGAAPLYYKPLLDEDGKPIFTTDPDAPDIIRSPRKKSTNRGKIIKIPGSRPDIITVKGPRLTVTGDDPSHPNASKNISVEIHPERGVQTAYRPQDDPRTILYDQPVFTGPRPEIPDTYENHLEDGKCKSCGVDGCEGWHKKDTSYLNALSRRDAYLFQRTGRMPNIEPTQRYIADLYSFANQPTHRVVGEPYKKEVKKADGTSTMATHQDYEEIPMEERVPKPTQSQRNQARIAYSESFYDALKAYYPDIDDHDARVSMLDAEHAGEVQRLEGIRDESMKTMNRKIMSSVQENKSVFNSRKKITFNSNRQ